MNVLRGMQIRLSRLKNFNRVPIKTEDYLRKKREKEETVPSNCVNSAMEIQRYRTVSTV